MNKEDRAKVTIFPPAVPLLAIFLGIGLNKLWPVHLGIGIPAPARYWIGSLIILGAFCVVLRCAFLFRKQGQHPSPKKPTPCIEDQGPYRLTRNPMYLQMLFGCLGFAVLLMNWWILFLTPLVAWILHRHVIRHEEAYLERKFGDTYLTYKKRVRRWI